MKEYEGITASGGGGGGGGFNLNPSKKANNMLSSLGSHLQNKINVNMQNNNARDQQDAELSEENERLKNL